MTWYAALHTAIEATLQGGPALARKLGHDATLACHKASAAGVSWWQDIEEAT